jgi:hypothetical protein
MESKKTAIAVAVISAVATIGAAVFSSLNKSESKSPSIQQTASGDGSVNVGGSAVFNATNDVTGDFCTRWNERESTWRKSWSCRSRGTKQSRS